MATPTIQETNFELPGQVGEVYHGKVGDVYSIDHDAGELLAVVRTDRISAYDVVLPETIPYKGQVLNQMSAELLRRTSVVAPNWLIDAPDPNVSIGFRAQPFKIEMILRGVLLGSAWKAYKETGMRDLCGNQLPDGMTEFEPFTHTLITPTTKAEVGQHDANITPADVIATGLATAEEYDTMAGIATDLFAEGQARAKERGLLLADTKYEFGRLPTGEIVVIDEVHTPDSSRYYPLDDYANYQSGTVNLRPQQLSKEFVREWLVSEGFTGEPGQTPPAMPDDFRLAVSDRYRSLYQRMLGAPFTPVVAANQAKQLEHIRANITDCLATL